MQRAKQDVDTDVVGHAGNPLLEPVIAGGEGVNRGAYFVGTIFGKHLPNLVAN